jgi:Lon protease-like protein
MERFRVAGEDDCKPYRIARVSALPEIVPDADKAELRRHRHRLEALLAAAMERSGSEPRFPPAVPDEDLVNALAQYLELDPLERQALLEREGVLARCLALIELLEIKTLAPRTSWKGRAVH